VILRIQKWRQRFFAQLIRVYGERDVKPPKFSDKPYSMKVDHFLPNSGFFGSTTLDLPTLIANSNLSYQRQLDSRTEDNSSSGRNNVSGWPRRYMSGTVIEFITAEELSLIRGGPSLAPRADDIAATSIAVTPFVDIPWAYHLKLSQNCYPLYKMIS
jgi:hypothetical protein